MECQREGRAATQESFTSWEKATFPNARLSFTAHDYPKYIGKRASALGFSVDPRGVVSAVPAAEAAANAPRALKPCGSSGLASEGQAVE